MFSGRCSTASDNNWPSCPLFCILSPPANSWPSRMGAYKTWPGFLFSFGFTKTENWTRALFLSVLLVSNSPLLYVPILVLLLRQAECLLSSWTLSSCSLFLPEDRYRNSLAVQWLEGLGAFNAMGPGRGTKILQASWRSHTQKRQGIKA